MNGTLITGNKAVPFMIFFFIFVLGCFYVPLLDGSYRRGKLGFNVFGVG
jgi:hypothetical protein